MTQASRGDQPRLATGPVGVKGSRHGVQDLFIMTLGTRRAGRKRGIGSALLLRALTQARGAGFTSASLVVDADSPTGALGLYERVGFTVDHTSVTQSKPLLP